MPSDSTKLDWVVSRIGAKACASACLISCADMVYFLAEVLEDVAAAQPDNL